MGGWWLAVRMITEHHGHHQHPHPHHHYHHYHHHYHQHQHPPHHHHHSFIHSFISDIYIAPLQDFYSEALPITARTLNRSFMPKRMSNCEWRTCPRSLRGGLRWIRTRNPPAARHRTYVCSNTYISRTCLYHLRQIRTIRHSLSPHAVNTLVHALIRTRVDFDNSIFAGLSSVNLSKLQSILHASARLICGLPKYSHISNFIRETLHWLPVPQRIPFTILPLMRNSLLGVAPSYLQALCTSVSTLPGRSALRSAARGLLVVPRMRGATAQSRSFAYVGPSSRSSFRMNCVLSSSAFLFLCFGNA